jgi:hypothetical protein
MTGTDVLRRPAAADRAVASKTTWRVPPPLLAEVSTVLAARPYF